MTGLDALLRSSSPTLPILRRRDQVVHDPSRAEHTWKAGAGMRAGANEVEIRQIFGAIVRAEVGRLSQDRLDGESRAQIAVECIAEMARVTRPGGHSYIQVDSWLTEQQHQDFLNWQLTAQTFFDPEGWRRLFAEAGYEGDYYWTLTE